MCIKWSFCGVAGGRFYRRNDDEEDDDDTFSARVRVFCFYAMRGTLEYMYLTVHTLLV